MVITFLSYWNEPFYYKIALNENSTKFESKCMATSYILAQACQHSLVLMAHLQYFFIVLARNFFSPIMTQWYVCSSADKLIPVVLSFSFSFFPSFLPLKNDIIEN